jgi:hypothetical protein
MRVTGFLTNTGHGGPGRQLADLELRHRRHARVEDRIRAAKDTGLRNLPFYDTDQNRLWVSISALAQDLLAWCARLALPATAAGYEPKRLRLRILAASSATRPIGSPAFSVGRATPGSTCRGCPAGRATAYQLAADVDAALAACSLRGQTSSGAPAPQRVGRTAHPSPRRIVSSDDGQPLERAIAPNV